MSPKTQFYLTRVAYRNSPWRRKNQFPGNLFAVVLVAGFLQSGAWAAAAPKAAVLNLLECVKLADGPGATSPDKSSFELTISSTTTTIDIKGKVIDPGPPPVLGYGFLTGGGFDPLSPATTRTVNNPMSTTLKWACTPPDAFKKGKPVSYGSIMKADQAFATAKATFDGPFDVPSLGWEIDADGSVFLLNANDSAISFSNLLFQYQTDTSLESEVSLLDAPPSGMIGSVSSGVVDAGTESSPGELYVGTFPLTDWAAMTAVLNTAWVDGGFSGVGSTVTVLGASQVPEPASASLFLLAGFGILSYRRARRG